MLAKEDYKKVFASYYPSHGRTGFTERNLTFYYCKNLLDALRQTEPEGSERSFAWMEAPLEKGEHIDAVVFSPSRDSVFFIEAKRMSNPRQKIEEIESDIERLLKPDNRNHIADDKRWTNQYILYLADVWLESNEKCGIPFWWTGKACLPGMQGRSSDAPDHGVTFPMQVSEKHGLDWPLENQFIWRFQEAQLAHSCLTKYCIMFGFCKIS
jgi:hypothetical protein